LKKDYKRIVIKIGSSLFYSAGKRLDLAFFSDVNRQITRLLGEGKDVVVVSSGAIALGMHLLGLKERPKKLEELQAAAAVGQNELMRKFFGKGWFSAQILLTWDDFNDRRRYLNAKHTLLTLLESRKFRTQRVVPIVNENDTVSTEEIKFGDNDRLSALVAELVSADILIILSDVDGLLDKQRKVLREVCEITPQVKALACKTDKKICVGGMITKIEAAKIAVGSGIPCVIANGRKKDIILSLAKEPGEAGTIFLPKRALTAKKHWIAFSTKAKGKIMVDAGAREALINNKSLLCVGVVSSEGIFQRGDIVSVVDEGKCEFARGKVNVSCGELEEVKGRRFDKEIIHRDNIVIL